MTNSRSTMFHSKLSELRGISTFLEGFCTATGVEREHCLRLNLVLEELFTNTVHHGHGGDSDAPVWMMLSSDHEGVHVIYEDTAPPFNPYARPPARPPPPPLPPRRGARGPPPPRPRGGGGRGRPPPPPQGARPRPGPPLFLGA